MLLSMLRLGPLGSSSRIKSKLFDWLSMRQANPSLVMSSRYPVPCPFFVEKREPRGYREAGGRLQALFGLVHIAANESTPGALDVARRGQVRDPVPVPERLRRNASPHPFASSACVYSHKPKLQTSPFDFSEKPASVGKRRGLFGAIRLFRDTF